MEARNVEDLKRGLVMGNGYSAAFSAACDDIEIREFCSQHYNWRTVRLQRDGAIVRAKPGDSKRP
jgi:hypothetical protein